MKIVRKVNRRSFLTSVTGAAFGGGALALVAGDSPALAQGCTDTDSGTSSDPGGQGRRCTGRVRTGYSDRDSGASADPAGYGRQGGPPQNNITDSDPRDPVGRGRGTGIRSGITDSDSGPNADPGGNGRGTTRPGATQQTELERSQSCFRLTTRRRELRQELLQPQYWDRGTIDSAIEDADQIDSILRIDPDEGAEPREYGQRQARAYEIASRYGVACSPTDRDCFSITLRRMASTAGRANGSAQHIQLQNELARIEQVMNRNCPYEPQD